jgi:hypothetical protein
MAKTVCWCGKTKEECECPEGFAAADPQPPEAKQMYRVEYMQDGEYTEFNDLVMLTDEEAKLVEARLTKAHESGHLAGWKLYGVDELCDYDDLRDTMEQNEVPE